MNDTELIELEFENKNKLPQEVKNKINTNILKNLIVAVIIMVYLLIINITYSKAGEAFEEYVKYYAFVVVISAVVLFELAYSKKSLFFGIIGIELLSFGVISLFIPYIYLHTNSTIRNVIILLPAILIIYYLIKSAIIFKKGKIDYSNSLSDIKDILKDDKKSYLDENSGKVFKEKLKEEAKIKEIIKKEQEIRKKKKIKNN